MDRDKLRKMLKDMVNNPKPRKSKVDPRVLDFFEKLRQKSTKVIRYDDHIEKKKP